MSVTINFDTDIASVDRRSPSVFEADLPTVSYEDAPSAYEAHRRIAEARSAGPVVMGAHGPELLSYETVRAALRDPRMCVPPGLGLEAQGITSGPLWDRAVTTLLSVNGETHSRLRRLVCKAFTPRSVGRLETTVTEIISGLVDPLVDTGRCEVVEDIARPYPVPVIAELLGAPSEDWKLLSEWADDFFKLFQWNAAEHEPIFLQAWAELDDYIDGMVAERRDSLTDDLISELIRAEDDGDRLSIEELRMLAAGILMAGTDTTRNQLAAAVDVLCDHPDQWELLAERPELAMNAVEEVMRFYPVVFGAMRMTMEDVSYDGVTIPAGSFVLVNTASANRDPAAYDDPDRLDITRQGATPMQTFGAGAHYCLGANLARRELAEALVVMTSRMRNLRRVGPATWKPLVGITGPATLPIAFDAR
ncbi:cytochrome P450 [Mycobacterium sp. 852002-51961_SCH5331710]|uniref:cytochrome P450 n=1 Tax=Mycobacterium sp. 852002-51961_SCH5331710 TaxID=1834105 RepID=UPI0007FD96D3|nr:cytochrome P450 [Mycobacterium sp. 852002-51961_SCH5331710]OBB48244.1 cytochrome [Mycobacterium sp. 852002-51961_SCH5331710]